MQDFKRCKEAYVGSESVVDASVIDTCNMDLRSTSNPPLLKILCAPKVVTNLLSIRKLVAIKMYGRDTNFYAMRRDIKFLGTRQFMCRMNLLISSQFLLRMLI